VKIFSKVAILEFNELYYNNTDLLMFQNNKDEDITHFQDLFDNYIYTIINIGTPGQNMMGIFNPDTNLFSISNQIKCYERKEYNYSLSSSNSSKVIKKIQEDDYFNSYSLVNETIRIYMMENNTKTLEEIKDFQFRYDEPKRSWGEQDTKDKIFCADVGLQLNKEKEIWARFIKQLKDKNLINSYTISLNYSNIHGGYFYIGEYPHEYAPDIFNKSNLVTTYAIPKQSFSQFRIIMESIYIQINKNDKIKIRSNEVYFHLESGLIECATDYFNIIKYLFFDQYLNNSICQIKTMIKNLNTYNMIVCEDNKLFDIKSFPSLVFYHLELNSHFSLNYYDLFERKNKKYYFLIVFSNFSGTYWKIGKPFLKKYQITLNLDAKSINFYNNTYRNGKEDFDDNMKNNNEKVKIIILIIVCVLLGVILIIVSYLFIKKIKGERKKRANELKDDGYEYFPEEEANKKNQDLVKDSANNNDEMPSIN
jgi:hypothetical protein